MEGIRNYNRMAEMAAMNGAEKAPGLSLKLNAEQKIEVPETDKKVSDPDNVVDLEAYKAQKEAEKRPEREDKENIFGERHREINAYIINKLLPEIEGVNKQIQNWESFMNESKNKSEIDKSEMSLVRFSEAALEHLRQEKLQLQEMVKSYDELKKDLFSKAYDAKYQQEEEQKQEEPIAA